MYARMAVVLVLILSVSSPVQFSLAPAPLTSTSSLPGNQSLSTLQSPLADFSLENYTSFQSYMLGLMLAKYPGSPPVSYLEHWLASAYNPQMKGFVCVLPSVCNCTDAYDYWADDDGKILTAASVVGNLTMARLAFQFIKAYVVDGYMLPARIVATRVHEISNGEYGNHLVGFGGHPLQIGLDLFGLNPVFSIVSVDGVSGSDYTISPSLDGSEEVADFGKANLTLSTADYLLLTSTGGSGNAVLNFDTYSGLAVLPNFTLVQFNLGQSSGQLRALMIYDPSEPIINSVGGFVLVGNITSTSYSGGYMAVSFTGPLRLYVVDITFDVQAAPYVLQGVARGDYPNDSDLSTPASFGYDMLGLALYGLESKNSTVIQFAKNFERYWFPIAEAGVPGNVYARSFSTFFMGAVLLEPYNSTIVQAAENYVSSSGSSLSGPCPPDRVALQMALINELDQLGFNRASLMQGYEVGYYRDLYSQQWAPYQLGEALVALMWAGLPYNSTDAVDTMNLINKQILPGSNGREYWGSACCANTEGLPAIIEGMALWQSREYHATGKITDALTVASHSMLEEELALAAVVVVVALAALSFVFVYRRKKAKA